VIVRTDLPREARLLDGVWIPMSDGCRLSARIWLPVDADADPVPAILEYLPYRKGDSMAPGDAPKHAYLAGHGYAGVRVDMRGSGDSEGHLRDEYTAQEQDDALEVIAWLAAQLWCSGAVGMMGISWGGFNALQVAARRPPALKAIVSMCSTDDRYANDEHYTGGCVMGPEMQSYATMLLGYAAHAPDPAIVGNGWKDLWRERLEGVAPPLPEWLSHQRRDAYWRHGSVCEGYDAMQCAVYMVGGWADGYRDAILRVLQGYRGPVKGLIGPWCHTTPHHGAPGSAVGFLQEMVRWWDHWLKGIENGVMDDPRLTFWMQDGHPPGGDWGDKTGRWLSEEAWPSANVTTRTLRIGAAGRLSDSGEEVSAPPEDAPGPSEDATGRGEDRTGLGGAASDPGEEVSAAAEPAPAVTFATPQITGIEGGCWISWSCDADSPGDQRPDDGRSRVFDSPPLSEPLEILGQARAVLDLVSDRPQALVAVRLCDVDETGASTLVARGVLNLTHHDGHDTPRPLVPGTPYRVEVPLAAVAYSFPVGHCLRLALATTQWPLAWPSARPATLTLLTGASRLELPVYRRPAGVRLPAFLDLVPEEGPSPEREVLQEDISEIRWRHEPATGCVEAVWDEAGGFRLEETGLVHSYLARDTYSIVDGDPLSVAATSRWEFASERGDWRPRVDARSTLTADESAFRVTCTLDAFDGDERIAARTWEARIPRDGC